MKNLLLKFLQAINRLTRNMGAGGSDSFSRRSYGELHLREEELKRKERAERENRQ